MKDIINKIKSFGLLEFLVTASLIYVISMLIWTASTRSAIEDKANKIKSNHKKVVEYMNEQVNICTQNSNSVTPWGENCKNIWTSSLIVEYILKNLKLSNPYSLNTGTIFFILLLSTAKLSAGKPIKSKSYLSTYPLICKAICSQLLIP